MKKNNDCVEECITTKRSCRNKSCRQWINFKKDFNCTLIAVKNNNFGSMTLREVAERMDVGLVRVKQIQDKALQKLQKNGHLNE